LKFASFTDGGKRWSSPPAIGATARDVIKTTVYVVADDRADLAVVWRAVQESGMADTSSTLLGVSLLGYEGQLVEIEAIVVLE
jgi:enamine deaminase RidA (YjgF/YER057c/UK114 family)